MTERRTSDRQGSMRVVETVERTLRRVLPVQGLRLAYRCGHVVLRVYWLIASPVVVGTKVVVRHEGRVLLLRHSYARRRVWDLPGGFIGAEESAAEAVARELREELGIEAVRDLHCIARETAHNDHKDETLLTFVCEVDSPRVTPSPAEIDHAVWFDEHALPVPSTPFTRRMVARARWPRALTDLATR